jgi:hypothetical protein
MRIKYLFLLLFIFQCFFISATPQRPDIIILNGIEYNIIPPSVMSEYYQDYPRKRPKPSGATNLYRGYIATYEIKNNELLVNDINGQRRELEDIRISDFDWINNLYKRARERCSNLPHKMKADWYSGLLFIAQDRLTPFYESRNGYFTVIEIENGNVIKSFVMSNEQCEKYFDARYKIETKSDVFQNVYNRLNDGIMPDEILEYFIRTYNK